MRLETAFGSILLSYVRTSIAVAGGWTYLIRKGGEIWTIPEPEMAIGLRRQQFRQIGIYVHADFACACRFFGRFCYVPAALEA
jgi:hypothetical protein